MRDGGHLPYFFSICDVVFTVRDTAVSIQGAPHIELAETHHKAQGTSCLAGAHCPWKESWPMASLTEFLGHLAFALLS